MQDDIEKLKKENEEPKELKISEESMEIKISEEPMEIKSPEKDENVTDWYDKNKFKKILAIVSSNKFNHKNKTGRFRYIDIKDLVDNINKNTISKILARNKLNALNQLSNTEIKNKGLISSQKELLNFFNNLLDTILTENNNNNNNNNEDENKDENKDENED